LYLFGTIGVFSQKLDTAELAEYASLHIRLTLASEEITIRILRACPATPSYDCPFQFIKYPRFLGITGYSTMDIPGIIIILAIQVSNSNYALANKGCYAFENV
jgi:hypothetical protein